MMLWYMAVNYIVIVNLWTEPHTQEMIKWVSGKRKFHLPPHHITATIELYQEEEDCSDVPVEYGQTRNDLFKC